VEAFFEEEELVFRAGAVVDDGDEEAVEVDFDAGEELWEWVFFEVAIVVEGELAGVEMDRSAFLLSAVSGGQVVRQ
jgi:hypothetical protein